MKSSIPTLLAAVFLLALSGCFTQPIAVSDVVAPIQSQPGYPKDLPAYLEIDPGSVDFSMSNGTGSGIISRDCYDLAVETGTEVFSSLFADVAKPGEEADADAWRILVRYEMDFRFLSSKAVADIKVALYPPGSTEPLRVLAAEGGQVHHIGSVDPTIRNALLRGYGEVARQIAAADLLGTAGSSSGD